MRAEPQHNEATGVRTSGSAPNGGTAWRPASRSPAHGADAPYCPANVGISDTTIHATRGPDLSTRTATVQPEPPTRSACANTGRNNELTKQQRTGMGARVRSLAVVRFTVSVVFVPRLENFFVLLSSRVAVDADNRVSELKNELKSRVLLFFRAVYPLPGDLREALRQTAGEGTRKFVGFKMLPEPV